MNVSQPLSSFRTARLLLCAVPPLADRRERARNRVLEQRHDVAGGEDPDPAAHDGTHAVRSQAAARRIIRLLGYEKLPRQDVKFNRRNIYARDGNKCQYCGKRMQTTELSLDHVVPKSQGGKTTWENIVCCCVKCNVKKGGRTPEQAHLHLITKPVKPKRSPVINIRLADERYHSWKQFLDTAYWTVELK